MSADGNPDWREFLENAISAHQQGEIIEARQNYLRVIEADPDHADALHLCGITYFQEDNYEDAERYIRAAISLDPDHKDYLSTLGLVLKSANRLDEAIETLLLALSLDDKNPDCLNNLGSTYVAAGRNSAAERVFRRLLEIDPDHVEGCNNLAVLLGGQTCAREACDLYERALSIQPNYLDAHLNYGRLLYRCDETEKAIFHFRAGIQLDDTNTAVYRELAEALQKSGYLDEALEVCESLLAIAPDDAESHVSLGSIVQQQGNKDDAEARYRHALDIDPDNARAYNNIGTLRIAENDLEAAIDHFVTAIRLDGDFVEAIFNMGTALQKTGRLAEAAGYFSMALARNPRLPNAYRYLSEIYRITDMRDSQVKVLRHWLEHYPDSATAQHLLHAAEGADVPARASDDFLREEFDGFADTFEETLADLEYSTPDLIGRRLETVDWRGPDGLDVLDAGCGTGLCGPILKPISGTLTGVDLSAGMIRRADARNIYDVLEVAELTAFMRHKGAAYDLVVSADTLVYFGDLDEVMSAASTTLRQGGRLIFSVEQLDEAAEGDFRLNPSGRYAHKETYVRRCLEDNGFSIEHIDYEGLRLEAQKPVAGLIVLARLTNPDAATP